MVSRALVNCVVVVFTSQLLFASCNVQPGRGMERADPDVIGRRKILKVSR